MSRRVVVHRNLLFVPNEAYIASQVEALRRYRPLLSGLSIDSRAVSLSPVERVVLSEIAGAGGARAWSAAMRFLRVAPAPLLEQIRDFKPDVFHVHFGGDAYWALPLARRVDAPLIVTFHGYEVNQRPGSSAAAWTFARLRPAVFRAARKIIVVSDFLKTRVLEAGCPPEKVVRHYIGVDTSWFSRRSAPDPRPTVAFVARLFPFKGCDVLIEAISRLPFSRDVKLLVAGAGPDEIRLRSLAASAGVDAEFLGALPREGVRSVMERSSLFCLPTFTAPEGHTETLSIVSVEAQSMGLPVISTRIGGLPEAVVDGTTGLLLAPRDVGAWSSALAELLRDSGLRSRMGAAARAHAVETFDLMRQTAKLEEIYDDVIGAPES